MKKLLKLGASALALTLAANAASAEGKLVVLLQTPGEGPIMERITTIEHMPGVYSVAMVYHEIDTQTEESA